MHTMITKKRRFVTIMLKLVTLCSLLLLPPMFEIIKNRFDDVYVNVNHGHFLLHPASIAIAVCCLVLPGALFFSVRRSKFATFTASLITLFIPLYLAYGLYVVENGLNLKPGFPTVVFWGAVSFVVVSVNMLLYLNMVLKSPSEESAFSSEGGYVKGEI